MLQRLHLGSHVLKRGLFRCPNAPASISPKPPTEHESHSDSNGYIASSMGSSTVHMRSSARTLLDNFTFSRSDNVRKFSRWNKYTIAGLPTIVPNFLSLHLNVLTVVSRSTQPGLIQIEWDGHQSQTQHCVDEPHVILRQTVSAATKRGPAPTCRRGVKDPWAGALVSVLPMSSMRIRFLFSHLDDRDLLQ